MNFQNLLRTTRLECGEDCHPAARPFHHLLRAILAWTTLWLSAALSSAAPLLTTQPADGLTSTSAVLHGSVIPQGNAMVYFEYGITSTYGNRTASEEVAGSLTLSVSRSLVALTGGSTYHVRLVAESGANGEIKTYGNDFPFTIPVDPLMAVTGNPVQVSGSGATLVGAVNPHGVAAKVRFAYGLTPLYGSITNEKDIATGSGMVNVLEPISGLTPGATYHYCIIATIGTVLRQGTDVSFVATANGGVPGTGVPSAAPSVTTVEITEVNTNAAELLGTVNPNGGTTIVRFEYGMTPTYGHTTALLGVGSGAAPVSFSLPAKDLLPGTVYHYCLLGSNSSGTAEVVDHTFITAVAAPTVVTGDAHATNTTSATVTGTVNARGAAARVFIDYGTSPTAFTNSVPAAMPTVTGEVTTAVSAGLTNLAQGTTYFYQVRAVNAGGTARGNILTFDVGVLYGLFFRVPAAIDPPDREGSVKVNLTPEITGRAWRIKGERDWRASGSAATGLTIGERVIEYRPVPGYLPPPDETVAVTGPAFSIVLNRIYPKSGVTGSGGLTVTLEPTTLTGAQWRLFGQSDTQWKNSNATITGLPPGNYDIECKAVAGRTTPQQVTANVTDHNISLVTITYLEEIPFGTPPQILMFETVSTGPYAYVGQIISDVGSGTGFVVRPRVVATAGHVVFDDVTLAATSGLRWYYQRQQGDHEPMAQTPRGCYLLSGYADHRRVDNSPGISTPQSQNLDAAALYFLDDAGRGGYGGYFASDSTDNEFVVSSAQKILVGYPVDGIDANNKGRMHATAAMDARFSRVPSMDESRIPFRTYTSADIRGSGGMSGGPLCVQHEGLNYFPAAIYLGGAGQTVVRAIDSAVVALFQSAEQVIYPVPVFTLQPLANMALPNGMKATLTAQATISMTSDTTLRYQWYEGESGVTTKPLVGATSPTFTPPPVTMKISYWVRAISDSCGTSADSSATTLEVLPSANANLSKLTPSEGVLSPAFNADIGTYTLNIPYTTSISVKPETEVAGALVLANIGDLEFTVASGSFSPPIPLTDIRTLIHLTVTSEDQTTRKYYTIEVVRALPPAMYTTEAATNVTQNSATLHGSVIPNGTVSAYFKYQCPGDPTAKVTPTQILSGGTTAMPVQATLSGLSAIGTYQYHLVVVSGTEKFNDDLNYNSMTFTINKLPLVATGAAMVVVTTGTNPIVKVTLLGAVNPFGTTTEVYFKFRKDQTTIYIDTPSHFLSNSTTVDVTEDVTYLNDPLGTKYFYRIVATNDAGSNMGDEESFILVNSGGVLAPVAITGDPSNLTATSVMLHGQVTPNGNNTLAYFEYGLDMSYGNTTSLDYKVNGSSMISFAQMATDLLPGTLYHYRCVAVNGSLVARGLDKTFITTALPPIAITGTAEALTSTSVKVNGTVRARGAPTTVRFEYATNVDFYNAVTVTLAPTVAGDVTTPVNAVLTGLTGDTLYYFRVKASNSGGTAVGLGEKLQANLLQGFMQRATSEVAANDAQGQVRVILQPSDGAWRFVGETRWRISETAATGLTTGDRKIEYQPMAGRIQPPSETVAVVSGGSPVVLTRYYFESARVGDLVVTLKPDAIASKDVDVNSRAQWRLTGAGVSAEWKIWRNSGDAITGIWPASYEVECKVVPGRPAPAAVTITVLAGNTSTATITYSDQTGSPPPVLDSVAGTAGVGNLSVLLLPTDVAANGAQWRLVGDPGASWLNSGVPMTGMLPGSYLVECKDVPGRTTPSPMKVRVRAGQTTTTKITYFTGMTQSTVNLQPVLAEVSTRQDLPYAYVGMLRSGTGGSYSGFVVKPQVVATVAQAVFDDATLTTTTDLQWLLQRNQDQFEPVPQIPRGSYVFTGYAALREAEQGTTGGAPGTLSNVSRNLNVAALYFNHNAGRGGFSGFLASATGTTAANEFLQSLKNKTLVGYPVIGIIPNNQGRMHATLPNDASYAWAFEQTYTNPSIQGVDGMLGGPLCVQRDTGGTYYPAGIFVGGDTGRAVRAIDSDIVSLFDGAALSGNGGTNDTGGGITHSSFSTIGSSEDPGAIKVNILPDGACSAGAGWRLSPEIPYRSSGSQKNGLSPGFYVLQFRSVTGYQEPTPQSVEVISGQLHEITFTYLEDFTALELWRLANFGTTSNTGNAADTADPDGDGSPNLDEYTAATDPNNSADVFKILTAIKTSTTFTVTASGKASRTYLLDRRASLTSGSWTNIDTEGPLGADGTVSLSDPSPPATAGFYRLRVSAP